MGSNAGSSHSVFCSLHFFSFHHPLSRPPSFPLPPPSQYPPTRHLALLYFCSFRYIFAMPTSDDASSSSHMMKTTKRGRPFLKVRFFVCQTELYSHFFMCKGYAGSVCDAYRLAGTLDTQAVLQDVQPFLLHVRFHPFILRPRS